MFRNGVPDLRYVLRSPLLKVVILRMNCVSLDTIGIAAFGYDFGALQGKNSDVEAAFDALGTVPPVGIDVVLGLLGPVFPIVTKIPTKRMAVLQKLDRSMQEIAENLLQRSRKDSEAGILSRSSRSIMGALSMYS